MIFGVQSFTVYWVGFTVSGGGFTGFSRYSHGILTGTFLEPFLACFRDVSCAADDALRNAFLFHFLLPQLDTDPNEFQLSRGHSTCSLLGNVRTPKLTLDTAGA